LRKRIHGVRGFGASKARRLRSAGLFVWHPVCLGGWHKIRAHVDLQRRQTGYWQIVRRDLMQARFGARRAEVHAAMREALAAEGWLAD